MEKRVERFMNKVLDNVYLKQKYKQRIAEDLYAHISEASQERSVTDVLKDMGHPHKLANDMMKTYQDDYEKMGFWNAVTYAGKVRHFEIKSKKRMGKWPMVHIATGYDSETGTRRVAKGIVAVGDIAIGAVSFGAFSAGLLSFGALTAGVISLGAVAVSLLFTVGALSISLVSAIGALAIGGVFAFGALAISLVAAIGDEAFALFYAKSIGEAASNAPSPLHVILSIVLPLSPVLIFFALRKRIREKIIKRVRD